MIADEDEATRRDRCVAPTRPSTMLARLLLALGPSLAVLKLGPAGALAHRAQRRPGRRSPGLAVPVVVDPVGAGDAFCAGFIAARLDGQPLDDRARLGRTPCGAAAVAAEGDQTGLPTRAELARLIAAGGPDTLR